MTITVIVVVITKFSYCLLILFIYHVE